jgi:hypothetical protein
MKSSQQEVMLHLGGRIFVWVVYMLHILPSNWQRRINRYSLSRDLKGQGHPIIHHRICSNPCIYMILKINRVIHFFMFYTKIILILSWDFDHSIVVSYITWILIPISNSLIFTEFRPIWSKEGVQSAK